MYDEIAKRYFLEHQLQLYPEEVCYDLEGAEEFLCDMDARIFDKTSELHDYMDRLGMDVSGLSPEELIDQPEVFVLPDNRYLYVEG